MPPGAGRRPGEAAPIAPGVLARLLPAQLRLDAQRAPGELLLDPDVQAGLGHARRPPGHRHPGPLVRAHALAGDLVEPEHPAHLLAGLHRQPPVAGRIDAGHRRSQPGEPAQQRAAAVPRGRRDGGRAHGRPRRRQPGRLHRSARPQERRARDHQPDLGDAQLLAALAAHHGPGAAARGCTRCSRPASATCWRACSPAPTASCTCPRRSRPSSPRPRPTPTTICRCCAGAADPAGARPTAWAMPRSAGAALAGHAGAADALPGRSHRLPHRPRPAARPVAPALLAPADGLPAAPGDRRNAAASAR